MVFSQGNKSFLLYWKRAVVTFTKPLSNSGWGWDWDRDWKKCCAQVLHSWKRCKILAEISKYNRLGGKCFQSLQQAVFNFLWLFGIINIWSPLWRFSSEDTEHPIRAVRSAKVAPFYWRGKTACEIPQPLSSWDPSFLFSQKTHIFIFAFLLMLEWSDVEMLSVLLGFTLGSRAFVTKYLELDLKLFSRWGLITQSAALKILTRNSLWDQDGWEAEKLIRHSGPEGARQSKT